jgi:pimeloyl-ACP methyl ester carboxylesterase
MAGMLTSSVTSADGTTIVVDRYGDERAIVLVGGAFAYRAVEPSMVALAQLLSADFAVFHYDRRRRGDSGDPQPYAIEREIEDLRAVVHEAGGTASVVGNSSGAVLSLDAAQAGVAVDKLILYEPPSSLITAARRFQTTTWLASASSCQRTAVATWSNCS